METLRVVLYHNDPGTAQTLAVSLTQHFHSVHLAGSYEEARSAVAGHRADALVLDLEASGPDEVERIHHEFPSLCIVGTHRLADDELWTEALNHGASDVCEPRKDDVVRSVSNGLRRHAAA
jgi:DNA-binding response OmpR family regulator